MQSEGHRERLGNGAGSEPKRAVCLDCVEYQAENMIQNAKRVECERQEYIERMDQSAGDACALRGKHEADAAEARAQSSP